MEKFSFKTDRLHLVRRFQKGLVLVTVDNMDVEMSRMLSHLGLFVIGPKEVTGGHQDRMPVTLILRADPNPLKVVLMDDYSEQISIVLYEEYRRSSELKLSREDLATYDTHGEDMGMSQPIQDMHAWACMWLSENERSTIRFDDSHSMDDGTADSTAGRTLRACPHPSMCTRTCAHVHRPAARPAGRAPERRAAARRRT